MKTFKSGFINISHLPDAITPFRPDPQHGYLYYALPLPDDKVLAKEKVLYYRLKTL